LQCEIATPEASELVKEVIRTAALNFLAGC
jgi:hypothetical protein